MSFAVISPSTERSPRPPIGREDELRWAAAGLGAAQRGAGALIAVEGAPGIGKSSVLREAQRRAEEMGMRVLATRAFAGEHVEPYALVRRLCAPARVDPSGATGELARAAGRLAGERSVLIAVDDVDRCDRESLHALAALALRLDHVGGVALLVARHHDAPWCVDPVALDALVGDPAAIRIRLGPLGPADAAAIVEARVGAAPEPAFAASVHRLTAGNPLLVSELALGVGERGIAPIDAHAGELPELALPGVARAVRARAADVDGDPAPLLGALAVLGDDATLSATAALAGVSYLDAADRCGALVTAGVLAAHDPPRFAQPLLRPAVYETVAPAQRLRLHGHAARALAAAGAPIDVVAGHAVAAAPAGDQLTAHTLRTAAHSACARGAVTEACVYLSRAIREGVVALSPELEHDLGLAQAALGDPGAAGHLERAYERAGSARARAQIGLALARVSAAAGTASSAREWCLTALAHVRESDDLELSVRLRAELTAVSAAHGEPDSAPAIEPAPGDGQSGWLLLALEADRVARSGGSRESAVELARRALSSPRVWRERGSLVPHRAVEVLVAAEHLEEAKATWDAGLAVNEQRGFTWDAAVIRAHRAGTLLRLGAIDAAIEDASAALDRVGDAPGPVRERAAATLAEALLERGSLGSAAALLDDLRSRLDASAAPEASDPWTALASARVSIAEQRYARALAELETAAEPGIAHPALVPWRSLAAECHVALGERRRAQELAAEGLVLAREFGAPAAQARALRALAHSAGGSEAALEPLREAARLLEDSPAQLESARTGLDLGIALSATNELDAGRDVLRRVMAIAHRCGARLLATQARDALVAAGGRPRRPINEGLDSLTRAERSVAELAAAGRTNREIGSELYVTLNTVATHLRSVYRKLNISSRAQLPAHVAPVSDPPRSPPSGTP